MKAVARLLIVLVGINLDDDSIAWADASFDITAEVVKQLALAVPR